MAKKSFGYYLVRIMARGGMHHEAEGRLALRRVVLGIFLWLGKNTRAKASSMRIPVDKLVEAGFVKEMW